MPATDESMTLDVDLPFEIRQFEVSHGCTSKGKYESTAVFIRYNGTRTTRQSSARRGLPAHHRTALSSHSARHVGSRQDSAGEGQGNGREFLFFGDVESSFRPVGSVDSDVEGKERARKCYEKIWAEAATSWTHGDLAGIFVSVLSRRLERREMTVQKRADGGRLNVHMIVIDRWP